MSRYFLIVFKSIGVLAVCILLICIGNSANAQLKVISNGNVGIGVSNPAEKLHVNDFILLGPRPGKTYSDGIKFTRSEDYPTSPAEWGIDTDKDGLNFWKPHPSSNWGNYKLFIKDNGNIGINTGSPSYKLDVNGTLHCVGFTNSS